MEVDGLDGTRLAIELVEALQSMEGLTGGDTIILLDGVTYAGFNLVDPWALHRSVGSPVIVVYRYPLDLGRIRRALVKNFPDYSLRLPVIERALSSKSMIETPWRIIEYLAVGISPEKAAEILRSLQRYSPEPEPLRVVDQMASRLSRLLHSRGFM